MPAATLRLAERLGGNCDVASLQREVQTLRGYRDVLHDTMKGLVEQSQGRLKPGDAPELCESLARVATALEASVADGRVADEEMAAALKEAQAEAARQRARAEQAEQRQRGNASASDDAANVVGELLKTAEEKRDSALEMASGLRAARRAADRAAKAWDVEAAALDAALVRQAALNTQTIREAEDARRQAAEAAAVASAKVAQMEKAQVRLEQAASEALAATAAAQAQACQSSEAKAEWEARARAEVAAAQQAARESQSQAELERGQAEGMRIERDRWQAEAGRAAIEIAQLREQLRHLYPAPQPQSRAAEIPSHKSRFMQYMDALQDQKAGAPAASLAVADASPRPHNGSTAAKGDATGAGHGGGVPTGAPCLRGAPSSRPSSGSGGAMRSSRERGGPLLPVRAGQQELRR